MERLEQLPASLKALGMQKLAIGGALLIAMSAMVYGAFYYVSRPSMDMLYAGLDRQDVASAQPSRMPALPST